jgi:hypothetical protein
MPICGTSSFTVCRLTPQRMFHFVGEMIVLPFTMTVVEEDDGLGHGAGELDASLVLIWLREVMTRSTSKVM